MLQRIEACIRQHDLIPPVGEVTCLVSGGADSTCLWHALGTLGYRVFAVHVNHRLRGSESEADARFCRETFGASVIEQRSTSLLPGFSENALRDFRYSATEGRGLRATGHTASDQVETVLYRLVSSGRPGAIKRKREDGVVRPLLGIWREETVAYCRERGLPFRDDSSNPETKRGLIRVEILPLLERLDSRARSNLLALAEEPRHLPRTLERTLANLLSSHEGTKTADLGNGVRAVREYDTLRLEGAVVWGPWTIEAAAAGLEVRARRPGDRLAGRRKKVQDLLVDAKVPRAERDAWPLVACGEEIVAVPGIAEAPGWEGVVTWNRA
ncbi:MAG: tRNA lysidine(34) synthetase TilS [Actinobacteria bacterium]|nr:tRNA lysidine(34) synthetase TilS [Actinomycetota bacterium]